MEKSYRLDLNPKANNEDGDQKDVYCELMNDTVYSSHYDFQPQAFLCARDFPRKPQLNRGFIILVQEWQSVFFIGTLKCK